MSTPVHLNVQCPPQSSSIATPAFSGLKVGRWRHWRQQSADPTESAQHHQVAAAQRLWAEWRRLEMLQHISTTSHLFVIHQLHRALLWLFNDLWDLVEKTETMVLLVGKMFCAADINKNILGSQPWWQGLFRQRIWKDFLHNLNTLSVCYQTSEHSNISRLQIWSRPSQIHLNVTNSFPDPF